MRNDGVVRTASGKVIRPIRTIKDPNGSSRNLSKQQIANIKEEISVRLSTMEYEYKEEMSENNSSSTGIRRRR